jgi:hypothetical protein
MPCDRICGLNENRTAAVYDVSIKRIRRRIAGRSSSHLELNAGLPARFRINYAADEDGRSNSKSSIPDQSLW